MSDITALLERWGQGDRDAFKDLLPVVYEELRKLAAQHLRHERPGHTLQPTALVHEAYLRLSGLRSMQLHNRSHFYGAAAEVMRRVLVDHARRRSRRKRQFDEPAAPITLAGAPEAELLDLDRALSRLAAESERCVRVVGKTCGRAFQNPNAPSPVASFGSIARPRAFTSKSSSFQLCSLSR